MTDNHTAEQRSKNMAAIRNKDTGIEIALRKELWRRGLRYRKNYRRLPGTPDIVFIGKKVAVFCDSEFWHGYDWEKRKDKIGSNREYWIPKIERNIRRDSDVEVELLALGYEVLRFWDHEIKKDVSACADHIQVIINTR